MRKSVPTLDQHKLDALIQRRLKLHLSQRDLEERMGLSERMVAKWESRIRSPTAGNLDRWVQALGLKLVFKKQ
jgi:transcriptional regulator with XRE-family HTH domain